VKTFAIQALAELAQDDQTLRPEVVGVATGNYRNSVLMDTKPLIERR